MDTSTLQKFLLIALDQQVLLAQDTINRRNVDQNEFSNTIKTINEMIDRMAPLEFSPELIKSYQEKVVNLQKSHEEMRAQVGNGLFSMLNTLIGMKDKLENMKEKDRDEVMASLKEDAKILKSESSKIQSA